MVSDLRLHRLNSLLQRELASIVWDQMAFFSQKAGVHLITVSSVSLSSDLAHAKVNVSVLCNKKATEKKAVEILNRKSPFLGHLLLKKISIRKAPKLEFVIDSSIKKVDKISQLLEQGDKKDFYIEEE